MLDDVERCCQGFRRNGTPAAGRSPNGARARPFGLASYTHPQVLSPLVGWVESSRPTRLSSCRVGRVFETHQAPWWSVVGLEDSTHPTWAPKATGSSGACIRC